MISSLFWGYPIYPFFTMNAWRYIILYSGRLKNMGEE